MALEHAALIDEIGPLLFGQTEEPKGRAAIALHERFLDGQLTDEQRQAFYRWTSASPELMASYEATFAQRGNLWTSDSDKAYFQAHVYEGLE